MKHKDIVMMDKLERMLLTGYKPNTQRKLTRGTKDLIKKALEETKSINRSDLCSFISFELEDKFQGNTLDYQLERMDLETTGKILEAIDTYFYKHINNLELKEVNEEDDYWNLNFGGDTLWWNEIFQYSY